MPTLYDPIPLQVNLAVSNRGAFKNLSNIKGGAFYENS